jgi:hypothetical protein
VDVSYVCEGEQTAGWSGWTRRGGSGVQLCSARFCTGYEAPNSIASAEASLGLYRVASVEKARLQ